MKEAMQKRETAGRFTEAVDLSEAEVKDGTLTGAVILEAGFNKSGKRYYPERVIKEAASLFAGVKMYLDHEDKKSVLPRSVRDWVSTMTESWSSDDARRLCGNIVPHNSGLREILENPVARKAIGLSIDVTGKQKLGVIDGKTTHIVESLDIAHSVDWVTEAGAGGRLMESDAKENQDIMLEGLTIEELTEARPDLVKEMREAAVAEAEASEDEDKKGKAAMTAEEIQERIDKGVNEQVEKVLADADARARRFHEQGETIKAKLAESKLPEVAQKRVLESVNAKLYEDDKTLEVAIQETVKVEGSYVEKLTEAGKVRGLDSQTGDGEEFTEEQRRTEILGDEPKKKE